jgi:hypothetical protein
MLAVSNELPVSRVKKIIQLDDDIVQCSNNATFVIAMATVRRILRLLYFVPHRLMSSIGDVHPVSR